jgi:hypothetical protein
MIWLDHIGTGCVIGTRNVLSPEILGNLEVTRQKYFFVGNCYIYWTVRSSPLDGRKKIKKDIPGPKCAECQKLAE